MMSSPPASKALNAYEARCAEEEGVVPTVDVVARSLEEAVAIDKIAACSGNLKGSLQKRLREASVAIRVLSERAQRAEGEGELALLRRDLKALADRNADLNEEVRKLRGEIDSLRHSPPPRTSPPGSPTTGGSHPKRGVPRIVSVETADVPLKAKRSKGGGIATSHPPERRSKGEWGTGTGEL